MALILSELMAFPSYYRRVSRTSMRVVACLIAHVALAVCGGVAANGGNESTKEAVLAAWTAREKSVTSYHFVWTQEEILMKDGLRLERASDPSIPADTIVPPRDVTLNFQCEIIVDRLAGIYKQDGTRWSPQRNEAVDQLYLKGIRDGVLRDLVASSKPEFPVGTIAKRSGISELLSFATALPITLCYRILHPDFHNFETHGMRMLDEGRDPSGAKVTVVSFPVGPHKRDLRLDPMRDFIPTRCTFVNSAEKTLSDFEIDYAPDPVATWVPVKWSARQFNDDGTPQFVRRAVVTSFDFNRPADDERLTVDFPAGTWVNDATDKSTYILLPSGGKHVLGEDEGVEDYEAIMGARWSLGRTVLVPLELTAGVALILLVYWLRRNRSSKGGPRSRL